MNLESEQAIGRLSNEVNRIQGLYKKWASDNNLSYGSVQVLYVLYFQGSVTQKKISESCEIPKQTVNNTIRDLKRQDLINMHHSKTDKRVQEISLNQLGLAYAKQTLNCFFKINALVYQSLGSNKIDLIAKEIKIFSDSIEKATNQLKTNLGE